MYDCTKWVELISDSPVVLMVYLWLTLRKLPTSTVWRLTWTVIFHQYSTGTYNISQGNFCCRPSPMSINWGYSEVFIFRFWLSCLTHCFNKISTISILKFWFVSKLLRHANLKFWFENILSSLLGDQMTFVIIYQLLQLLFEYHLIYTSRLIGIRGKNFQLKEKCDYVFPYNFGL